MASHAGMPRRVLVGREAELEAVREVLNRAADGQSETLLVFGEGGVGKTVLVQHAVAGASPATLLLSGRWMGWRPSRRPLRCWMTGCMAWPAPDRWSC